MATSSCSSGTAHHRPGRAARFLAGWVALLLWLGPLLSLAPAVQAALGSQAAVHACHDTGTPAEEGVTADCCSRGHCSHCMACTPQAAGSGGRLALVPEPLSTHQPRGARHETVPGYRDTPYRPPSSRAA